MPNKTIEEYKYSAVTKDGFFIQSNNIDDFRLQDLESFTVTEKMTKEEVIKHFGLDYKLPEDFPTNKQN